jgi:hypothetical protein
METTRTTNIEQTNKALVTKLEQMKTTEVEINTPTSGLLADPSLLGELAPNAPKDLESDNDVLIKDRQN